MTAVDIIYALAFYAIAAVAVASAFVVVWHRHPIINALYLLLCFFAVAAAYVLLKAHFLAAIQVLVYAGAVLVLFLMIILLLDLRDTDIGRAQPTLARGVGGAAAFGLIVIVAVAVSGLKTRMMPDATRAAADRPEEVAQLLVQLGENPQVVTGRVTPRLSIYEGRPVVVASASVLAAVQHPPTRELMRTFTLPHPATGVPVPKLPRQIAQLSDEHLLKLCITLSRNLNNQLVLDLEKFEVLEEYPELSKEEVVDLIKAAAWARLKYMTEFGTTAAVGRQLFSRHYLPFEAAGVLLLAAIIGVVVMARRPRWGGGEG